MAILVIHGGAGTIRDDDRAAYRAGLARALAAGRGRLRDGAHAAALASVVVMEDDADAFNAGTGGSPTREGRVECDAALMLSDGSSGAVACVGNARNPILVAERVRRETPHALFVGAGAERLVTDPVDNERLLTDRTRAALARWRASNDAPAGSATVGAVALDDRGRLAAATSTGGMLGKWPGRVGDSPLVGAGTYADARVAVSCTGYGEAFLRTVAAHALAERLARGDDLAEAVRATLADVARHGDGRLGGAGGVICATADGRLGVGWTTPHMAYGFVGLSDDGRGEVEEVATVGLEADTVLVR